MAHDARPDRLRLARRAWPLLAAGLVAACGPDFDPQPVDGAQARETSPWPAYGGPGGRKFGDIALINRANVADLALAWTYRTGDASTVFQSSPILADGQLVFCSPMNRVVALDPLTGGELWTFDPRIDRTARPANEFNCRGVARWPADGGPGEGAVAACAARIFTATNDARLIALDSRTGARCTGFGLDGEVDLAAGVGRILWDGEYQVTSPPAVVGDLVVVGSAVSDGNRVEAPSGVVRAFDARTGALAWAFDLAPPGYDRATRPVSEAGWALGTPNVWSAMVVDPARDLVFLPTGNPAPDYDRPETRDLAYYGSSVVALRGSTGEVVWHFRTVLNDLWDFDVPAQPVLADIVLDGTPVPVLVQATKMGFVFVLNRATGVPVVEVQDLPVPRHGPLAAQLSPVQPFPPAAFRTSRTYVPGESLLGLCDARDAVSVAGPVYTPITGQWTIGLPSNMGAINWGGVAVDAARGRIVVHTNSVPFRTRLIAREEAADLLAVIDDPDAPESRRAAARAAFRARFDLPDGVEVAPQHGANHLMARHVHLDPVLGMPCAGAPLAEMMVIDIQAQEQVWRRPHGTLRDLAFVPLAWGAPGVGGPLMTAGGLVFIGGAAERTFRAYDADTGAVLWEHRLPEPGNANPMTYTVASPTGPRQFVVIAAGGDARAGVGGTGDHLVAFALPATAAEGAPPAAAP